MNINVIAIDTSLLYYRRTNAYLSGMPSYSFNHTIIFRDKELREFISDICHGVCSFYLFLEEISHLSI